MKKFFFAYAWLLLSAGMAMVAVAFVHFTYYAKSNNALLALLNNNDQVAVLSEHDLEDVVSIGQVKGDSTLAETQDARATILANFLKRYNSPMKPYDYFGQKLVEIADTYGIDFRLLPAIAMQESNLCKKIPEGSYNCLGFGIHERGTLKFDSYEANFDRAGRELKKYYIDRGLTTPEQIMAKYTPSSKGSWANSVMQWMTEMKYDDRKLGKENKYNASVLEYAKPTSASATITPAIKSSNITPTPTTKSVDSSSLNELLEE